MNTPITPKHILSFLLFVLLVLLGGRILYGWASYENRPPVMCEDDDFLLQMGYLDADLRCQKDGVTFYAQKYPTDEESWSSTTTSGYVGTYYNCGPTCMSEYENK